MSMLANTPRDKAPKAFVNSRFVSEVQAYKYWKRKWGGEVAGWRIRITHETVFRLGLAPFVSERLVAFYLMDYGSDCKLVSEEYSDVLFTMTISDFLYYYEPVSP